MEKHVYLGVDGGGTKCTIAAVDETGAVLGREVGEGVNFYSIGMPRAREIILQTALRLTGRLGLQRWDALCIGMSALDDVATEQQHRDFCADTFDPESTVLCSDLLAALYGFTYGEPGAMLVSGTGMMGIGLGQKGEWHITGGFGYLLGDEGSCYAIGLRAIQSAIHNLEDGRSSPLTDAFLRFYGVKQARDWIPELYGHSPVNGYIASFAKEVTQLARFGDSEAQKAVDEAVGVLVRHGRRLLQKTQATCIGVYGGLFEHNREVLAQFSDRLKTAVPGVRVIKPSTPPELGAVVFGLERWKPAGWKAAVERIAGRQIAFETEIG